MDTNVNKEFLLEFFLTFSRFEYALKVCGFFKRNRGEPHRSPRAEPDWDCFANSLISSFDPSVTQELRDACDYLSDSPPNQQVIINDKVAWETPVRDNTITDIEFLLRMVRCVRNNLFHGGKYGNGVHEDSKRTESLLKNCIIILKNCLSLVPQVSKCFNEAKI